MKLLSYMFFAFLLFGCSNKSMITLGDGGDLVNAVINVPRAIAEKNNSPECRYKHPDERAACREKKQKEVEEMTESMKKEH